MPAKKTKIRITAPGIYGADGAIPVGEEFEIAGDPPKGWKGKCVVINAAAEKAKSATGDKANTAAS